MKKKIIFTAIMFLVILFTVGQNTEINISEKFGKQ